MSKIPDELINLVVDFYSIDDIIKIYIKIKSLNNVCYLLFHIRIFIRKKILDKTNDVIANMRQKFNDMCKDELFDNGDYFLDITRNKIICIGDGDYRKIFYEKIFDRVVKSFGNYKLTVDNFIVTNSFDIFEGIIYVPKDKICSIVEKIVRNEEHFYIIKIYV